MAQEISKMEIKIAKGTYNAERDTEAVGGKPLGWSVTYQLPNGVSGSFQTPNDWAATRLVQFIFDNI